MRLFGKCNNPNGHGHNYVLEVTVVGRVDMHTGMVMNITDLKYVIQEHVLKFIDHKHLDKDVNHFRTTGMVSTTENLAVFIWQQLCAAIHDQFNQVSLYEVKLHETEKNVVVYRGD
jgi:6-pyruvoyltetrahydropterin/6-carboxytetrahydropterin synthase